MKSIIDVLYIHPSKSLTKPTYCVFPIGIVGLLNLLKDRGYNIKALNYGVEIALNNKFSLKKYLEEINYRIVAIDMHWFEHIYSAVEIANICKKINQNCKIIIGGFTASIFADEIITQVPSIDFVIRGEGEYPFVELCKYILTNKSNYDDIPNLVFRKDDKLITTPFEYSQDNIDNLNFVDIDFFSHPNLQYKISDLFHGIKATYPSFFIYLQRGCIYDCSTCGGATSSHNLIFGKNKFITRGIDKVFSDIERLSKKGIKRLYVVGDLNLCNKNYYTELFKRIAEKKLDITIHNDVYQLPSYELIDEFAKVFKNKDAKLIITPLSGNEEVRIKNGKLFTNKQLLSIINYMKQKGIKTDIFFQVYLPYETNSTFLETIKLADEISKIYNYKDIWFKCDPVRLDPGSPMRLHKEKFNISHKLNNFIDYYHYSRIFLKTAWSYYDLLYCPEDDTTEVDLKYMQSYWVIFKTKIFIKSLFDKHTIKRRLWKR